MEENDNGRPLRANDIQFYSNVFYHIALPETAHKDVDEIVNGVRYTGIRKIAATGSILDDPDLQNPGSGRRGNSGLPVDFLNKNRLSGYALTSASPCFGAGADAANNGSLDFRGKVLMSPPDIGVYESDATVEHICDMCPVCGLCTCKDCGCNESHASCAVCGKCLMPCTHGTCSSHPIMTPDIPWSANPTKPTSPSVPTAPTTLVDQPVPAAPIPTTLVTQNPFADAAKSDWNYDAVLYYL